MAIKGTAVVAIAAGGILFYAGLKGKSISSATRVLLQGQDPSAATPANQITAADFMAGGTNTGTIPTPIAQGASAAKNQLIAKGLAVRYGWAAGNNWSALVALWNRESGWNQYAKNPTTGAYGIPQANPGSKLPRLGQPPFSIASVQIAWGLSYIKQRYGNPVTAWEHEQANGWY